ncbi:hypothetical protein DIPPA_15317, partial [Diplonema papillatum]
MAKVATFTYTSEKHGVKAVFPFSWSVEQADELKSFPGFTPVVALTDKWGSLWPDEGSDQSGDDEEGDVHVAMMAPRTVCIMTRDWIPSADVASDDMMAVLRECLCATVRDVVRQTETLLEINGQSDWSQLSLPHDSVQHCLAGRPAFYFSFSSAPKNGVSAWQGCHVLGTFDKASQRIIVLLARTTSDDVYRLLSSYAAEVLMPHFGSADHLSFENPRSPATRGGSSTALLAGRNEASEAAKWELGSITVRNIPAGMAFTIPAYCMSFDSKKSLLSPEARDQLMAYTLHLKVYPHDIYDALPTTDSDPPPSISQQPVDVTLGFDVEDLTQTT